MKRLLFLSILVSLSLSIFSQEIKRVPQKVDWRVEVLPSEGVFYAPAQPVVELMVYNDNAPQNETCLSMEVTTDDHRYVASLSQRVNVSLRDSVSLAFSLKVDPGFYICTVKRDGIQVKRFNIGFEPEKIVSLPDHQADFNAFWVKTLHELSLVAPDYQLTFVPEHSSKARRCYLVKMKSLGGVEIGGYYMEPTKRGKHPAVVIYIGYGSKPWIPDPDNNKEFAEFVLSHRGQSIFEESNPYGDWICYGLDSEYNYYYRGAYADAVRAVDFLCSRSKVDNTRIFAEGGSQGGALTLVACALDHRIRAAAPYVPFMSDFPDYFHMVDWPATPVIRTQREKWMSDEALYRVLSYFDVKNFAPMIQCPVVMAVGLQDVTCPPHTNFSSYNLIPGTKKYYIFPNSGHSDIPATWWQIRYEFIQQYL